MRRTHESDEEEEETQQMTQFSAHDSDNANDNKMWEVLYIKAESRNKYQVQWAGIDPATGEPWKPDWIGKEDCTDELIREWKQVKARKAEAKKRARTSQRPRSVGSNMSAPPESSRGSHQPSREVTTALLNPRGLQPYVEIPRKRPRASTPKPSAVVLDSEAVESDAGSVEMPRARKRRRVAQSPKLQKPPPEPSESDEPAAQLAKPAIVPTRTRAVASSSPPKTKAIVPSPRDLSNATVIQDSQQQFDSSQPTGGSSFPESPQRQRVRILGPVPQVSPSLFRENLPPPLSPVEQFDSPPHSSKLQKNHSFISSSKQDLRVERIHQESQRSHVTSPQVSQRAKTSSSQQYWAIQGGFSHGLSQDVNVSKEKAFTDLVDATRGPRTDIADRGDEGIEDHPILSPRPSASASRSDALPLQLSSLNLFASKTSSDTSSLGSLTKMNNDLRLMARDSTIRTLETRLAMLKHDVELRQRRLEEEVEEHARSKSILEAQITSLTTALKQFASLSPDGIEAILRPKPAIATVSPLPPLRATPPPYVRSAEDEAIIAQLREENASLQDQTAKLHAEKTASDAMVEQVRDVARRAEAAKSDLARQTRKFEIIAANAPKNAEELYRSQIREAEEKVQNYKAQVGLLTTQNLLTGDNIRKKAAKCDVLARKYQNLLETHEKMFEELNDAEEARDTAILLLHRIRDTLAEVHRISPENATLEKLMPLVGGIDGTMENVEEMQEEQEGEQDQDEEREDEEHEAGAEHSPMSGMEGQQTAQQEYDELIPRVEDGGPAIVVEEVMDLNQRLYESQSQRSDENVFVCLWHPTDISCPEFHSSREVLVTHIYHDHHDTL